MTTAPQPEDVVGNTIHPATRMGYVQYIAADIERQIEFYESILGLQTHWREGSSAGMGAGGEDLLRLTEVPGARRAYRTTGLYHTAFLVPERRDLAHLLMRIAETQTRIQGMTDHGTHWAIYLPDAEGNGIELAWDFPRERWPTSFEQMMRRNRALNTAELMQVLQEDSSPWDGPGPGTAVGHVHLHVAQIPPTRQFYHEVLGFNLSFDLENASGGLAETAAFFNAGDYHHHIGANTWLGEGAPPPPDDAIGLRYFTIILPDQAALEPVLARIKAAGVETHQVEEGILLHDPSYNGILLTTANGGR